MNYEDEAFDELEKKLQKQVAHGITDGSLWRKRQEPEALKLALEALESMKETLAEHDEPTTFNEDQAIIAIKEALAQPEQPTPKWQGARFDSALHDQPPQRTWVGLTDGERQEIALEVPIDAVLITETKLKEKNG